jgi:hypothetical protein
MRLSENFSLEEFTYSSTAEQKGIANTIHDTDLVIPNAKALCQKVLQKVRNQFGPIIISSGYSNAKLSLILGRKSYSQHCFDPQTEILTATGWKNIYTIDLKDKVYSYNMSSGKIEPDDILELIIKEYKGEMVLGKNHHIDFCVTDKHRMVTAIPPKKGNPKWCIEEADKIYNKRRLFLTSALNNNPKSSYDLRILKLCMAIICDGCLSLKKGTLSHSIGFTLSKKRKIDYIEKLLNELKIPYTKRYCLSREKQGQFGVYAINLNQTESKRFINIIGTSKKIPSWFLQLSSEELQELVYTYSFFDGSKDKRSCNWNYFSMFSKDRDNIDMLQAMCVLAGLRCTRTGPVERITNFGPSKLYILNVTPKTTSRLNEIGYSKELYDGIVWCIRTNNTTLICRRNGKAFICGNCIGQAADIVSKNYRNYDIAVWIRDNLDFDQLIYEVRRRGLSKELYDWVHVSYKKDGRNRREVLFSPPEKGYKTGLPEKSYV